LAKAQQRINTLGPRDTARLLFDRGDTWVVDTTLRRQHHFRVKKSGPTVHIAA
jgi:hypothetical protein